MLWNVTKWKHAVGIWNLGWGKDMSGGDVSRAVGGSVN